MSEMNKPAGLNFKDIKSYIDEGYETLKPPTAQKKAVLVIGDTGVGKSTFVLYMAGAELIVKKVGLGAVIDSLNNPSTAKIGHGKASETFIPIKVQMNDMDFFDCSGFEDNRGEEYQIGNAYFLKRLFKLYKEVKIVLMIDQSYLTECRFKKLPRLLQSLKKGFSALKKIQQSVVLVVSKAKESLELKDYISQLQSSISTNEQAKVFLEEDISFLSFLISAQRITLLKEVVQSKIGQIVTKESLPDYWRLIKEISFIEKYEPNYIISEGAQLSLRKLEGDLISSSKIKFEEVERRIRKALENKLQLAITRKHKCELIEEIDCIMKQQGGEQDEIISSMLRSCGIDIKSLNIRSDMTLSNFLSEIIKSENGYMTFLRKTIRSELMSFKYLIEHEIEVMNVDQTKINELANHISWLQEKLLEQSSLRKKQKQEHRQYRQEFQQRAQELFNYGLSREKEVIALLKQMEIQKKEHKQQVTKLETIIQSLQLKDKERCKQQSEKLSKFAEIYQAMRILIKSHIQKIDELFSEVHQLILKQILIEQNFSKNCEKPQQIIQKEIKEEEKMKKYPEIDCPHFLNGGQCIHCIDKWKTECNQEREARSLPKSQN